MARSFWISTLGLLAVAVVLAVVAPQDPHLGPIQRVLYLHLPAALNTFLAAIVMFVASVAYLGGRRERWDDVADAAARVTVLNATVLLLTGMFWARSAWGVWWTWSPRLAFSLLLWVLYAAYLLMRALVRSPQRAAVIGAVYGVVAFLDVPLVYLSVKLLPDIHPSAIELSPAMRAVLLVWMVPVTMLSIGLIAARAALTRRTRELAGTGFAGRPGEPRGVAA